MTPEWLNSKNLRGAALILGLLAIGLALRAWVISSWLGDLGGDEAFAGLQSIGVVREGRLPVVIDGQVYTAAIDAILFGPFIAASGGSIAVLKWLYVGFWAAAAAATFGATARLRDRKSAALATALMWLAPGALLVLSTRTFMGYAIGMAGVVCTVWAAAISADQPTATVRQSAITGFIAGFAFYIHPVYAAVLVPAIAIAAYVHRRDWRTWWLPASVAAIVANLPFIAWNALNGWPTLTTKNYPPGSYFDRFEGFITELLPRALGVRKFDGTWVFGRPVSLLIYVAVVAGVVYGCVVLVKANRGPSRWIVPAALIASLPLMAFAPHLTYTADGRYAIIPYPLMAIALGAAGTSFMASWNRVRITGALVAGCLLWVAVTTLPFLDLQNVAVDDDPNAWQVRVIDRLDELGIDRLAGLYWFVLPIEYRSDRAIRTAIAGNPFKVRFPESQRIVQNTPPEQVAFLFPPGEQHPSWFYLPVDSYRTEDLGGMILYIPLAVSA